MPFSCGPVNRPRLDKLNALRTLPDCPWRFHVDGIAHGEPVTLDERSWQVVTAKSKAPKEAVWYCRRIEGSKTLDGYDLN